MRADYASLLHSYFMAVLRNGLTFFGQNPDWPFHFQAVAVESLVGAMVPISNPKLGGLALRVSYQPETLSCKMPSDRHVIYNTVQLCTPREEHGAPALRD